MRSPTPAIRLRRVLHGFALACLSVSILFLINVSAARAQTAAPADMVLVPGTVVLGNEVNSAILASLKSSASLFPGTTYFAVTDWRQQGSWAIASVIGLSQLRGGTWSIDDGTWVGVVLLYQSQAGAWQGATQGTKAFSSLIVSAPNSFLSATAKRGLDPLLSSGIQSLTTGYYIFPLQPGSLMYYGNNGIHDNGFNSVTGSAWKAVDLMSDGAVSQNHAPNLLLASEAGTISYTCKDSNNTAIRIGDFFYTHLENSTTLVVGASFNQGGTLGTLKTGTFGTVNEGCGWADQPSNWFHVHWGFPNANLQVEDWTLSMTTGYWTNGTTTVKPGQWFLAGPTPPMPANLTETSATQTVINFAWGASSGADGYHIYSWNGAAYALLDTVPATQTTYMEMRSLCGWSQNYQVSAYNSIGDSPRAGPLHAATIPCDPSPLGPANGSSNRWNFDVTFQSNAANGATGYFVEYWGGSLATTQTCGWSSTPSCHVGILPPGNTYSWHVKARSSAGETAWSDTWTFTILPLPCDTLTVAHTGNGTDPVPAPQNSAGCSAGQYHPTEVISLTSAPATAWTVGSWSGTDNNSSTSTTNTLTMPDGNSTVTVNYTPIVPGIPVLVSPPNAATKQPINLTLMWNAASGAISYDYCLSTSTTCTSWVTTGTLTSVALTNLNLGTRYYWWVRATNIYGNTSTSALWYFTIGSAPGGFSKSSPLNGAAAQPANTLLQWTASSDAAEYQYCLDTTNDGKCQGDNWISSGTARSADLTGQLSVLTTYYWQVRAINSFGTTYPSDGWFSFTTSGVPGLFTKQAPANARLNVPVRPTLTWSASLYATGYEYCMDRTNDGACDGNRWVKIPASTSFIPSAALQPLTTYYWQVHALNSFGTTPSNGDAWWSFTTGALPGSFAKSRPANGASNQALRLSLTWQASSGATSYLYCLSSRSGTCSTSWISTGTATSASVSGLAAHKTYYWQVRAQNSMGVLPADAGAWWSFTTGYLPAAFAKTRPTNAATNISLSPTLSWSASAYATTYDYCLSTTSTCTAWVNVGNVTSRAITGLKAGTLYYWQVRARNSIAVTAATGGLWSFRTGYPPARFSQLTPLNGSLNQPLTATLTWGASTGATSYKYCIDITNDNVCTTQWVSTGLARSVALTSLPLVPNTTYYWRVIAVNSFGVRYSGWWSFTTTP